ncbi:MAG TPA: serine hydrolase domain-containing protein [Verrucomicrobiae bacterium]|nr:serine hydrolase domain-containing protein [Verrucomicrobiae bacterium]
MRRWSGVFNAGAFILLSVIALAAADQQSGEVNKLFARWDTSTTPGMNVLVLRDGQPVYSHSFGMANLELSKSNDSALVYPVGSLTKQFTAYCVHLLAKQGKLALTDDVRKYIPEMHDFGEVITLQMLLHHTSGLRDNVDLLTIKGRRVDDVISEDESFDVITGQLGLNFPPASHYRYSNANYVLLAKIVERVSGMKFSDFLKQHVFLPFGMAHTSLVTDPLSVTPNRAYGYSWTGQFTPQTAADSTYGNTGILSTISDLEIWSSKFWEPGTSTPEIFAAMKQPGVLRDGIPITYASGLHAESFHGMHYVEHTGAVPGFRSDVLVFPAQKLSIILLANTDNLNAPRLAFSIAEIYLRDEYPALPERPRAVPSPGLSTLQKYAGTYEILSGTSEVGPGRQLTFQAERNALRFTGENAPLLASSGRDFFSSTTSFHVTFLPTTDGTGHFMVVVHDPSGTDFAGRRIKPVLPRKQAAPVSSSSYLGLYYSAELATAYEVTQKAGALSLRTPRGVVALEGRSPDVFAARGNLAEGKFAGTLEFSRAQGSVTGFLLTTSGGRAANIPFAKTGFSRVSLVP